MQTIEIPKGIEVRIDGEELTIKGRLGSTTKKINRRLMRLSVDSGRLTIEETKNKKLTRKALLAITAFASEIRSAFAGAENGLEKSMTVFFAHFPMTIEVKGRRILIKNIFGERVARETSIIGDTKVEVKGQELKVRGVDAYDVGQTVANIRKACYSIGDTRVFQDGVYLNKSE